MTKRREDLAVGQRQTVTGVYTAHWEFTRFTVSRRLGRWPWPRRVHCQLVASPGVAASPLDVAGITLPPAAEWRHHPGLRFRVTAEVTPLEHGHFGHRGALRWRLQVEEWLDVRGTPPRAWPSPGA